MPLPVYQVDATVDLCAAYYIREIFVGTATSCMYLYYALFVCQKGHTQIKTMTFHVDGGIPPRFFIQASPPCTLM